ncbi:MAG: hypothetical protein A2Y17_11990 [Clostridiales bacterium GWF2_38_85]|nr:MAG: hypothetical protein A2Y17_11990 [Clostridiales bacterium GWF2_38_85]HBL85422.1 TlyA family rRNA (cytidine-2'-O)-methyltransferase [Clostridiales bacterium]
MTRLDVLMVELGLCESRNRASMLIKSGSVLVDGQVESKPSRQIDCNPSIFIDGWDIQIIDDIKYVSRAGIKLEAALDSFEIDVTGKTAVDIGASTGGFCDCLIQRDIDFVYAVDVGKDQLHPKIKENSHVLDMPGINARTLTKKNFNKQIDIVTMDVSFISQTLIYPAVSDILTEGGVFVSLIKPQFEVGRENIGKRGIVRGSKKLYGTMFENIKNTADRNGLALQKYIDSPIKGSDGNIEFLAFFKK